ncbi:hypothetical protein J6590_032742 [Homalodisca vitripennis]|nr:hypothetical protein J6590_032742 [Homalodisca vitripennis]
MSVNRWTSPVATFLTIHTPPDVAIVPAISLSQHRFSAAWMLRENIRLQSKVPSTFFEKRSGELLDERVKAIAYENG